MENVIEIKGLSYSYQENLALDHVDMNIQKGSITTILGGNGAGKSTLFLNLNGVLKPEVGEIKINGKPLEYTRKGLLEMRKNVGIVFQDPDDQLFSSDVYRDISFGPVNLGLPKEQVKERVRLAMEKTRVDHLAQKPTHALSYGQKKRVAIAGILAMEPSVIILDEPTAGLDPQGVDEIMELLFLLKQDKGISIIIATHDMDLVPLYSDYVFVMKAGKIMGEGTPQQVFGDPYLIEANSLRLPILSQLMKNLVKDGLPVDPSILTMEEVRQEIKKLHGIK